MFARTERLLLRPAWGEDAASVHRAIADEGVVRNLSTVPWPYRTADAENWIAAPRTQQRPTALILKRHVDTAPELIGAIGISDNEDGVELGYWLARRHWGHGYATEAGRAMISFARDTLRLKRLVAGHYLDNPASGRVLRKLGFQATGAVRMRQSLARGSATPSVEFVLELDGDAENDRNAACPMAA